MPGEYNLHQASFSSVIDKNVITSFYNFLAIAQFHYDVLTIIVDFYCHKYDLIIEVDGSQHYTEQGMAYDTERSAVLEYYGSRVLRFTNNDVDFRFKSVCEAINNKIEEALQAAEPPAPLKGSREG